MRWMLLLGCVSGLLMMTSCWEGVNPPIAATGFNALDEVKLAQQIHESWKATPDSFHILDPVEHKKMYDYLYGLRAFILGSGLLEHQATMTWEIYVVYDDSKADMFTTTGGYIYIYTGLLKYLSNENQLLNLLAHEMYYADNRYYFKQFLKEDFTFPELLDAAQGGNTKLLKTIADHILAANYDSETVKAADEFTVEAICTTPYKANGLAEFLNEMGNTPLRWWLRHTNSLESPTQRISRITDYATQLGCTGSFDRAPMYLSFLTLLP